MGHSAGFRAAGQGRRRHRLSWAYGSYGDDYGNLYAGVGDFGANGNDTWNWRINFNFRYYF